MEIAFCTRKYNWLQLIITLGKFVDLCYLPSSFLSLQKWMTAFVQMETASTTIKDSTGKRCTTALFACYLKWFAYWLCGCGRLRDGFSELHLWASLSYCGLHVCSAMWCDLVAVVSCEHGWFWVQGSWGVGAPFLGGAVIMLVLLPLTEIVYTQYFVRRHQLTAVSEMLQYGRLVFARAELSGALFLRSVETSRCLCNLDWVLLLLSFPPSPPPLPSMAVHILMLFFHFACSCSVIVECPLQCRIHCQISCCVPGSNGSC